MHITFITVGDPTRRTGGYLYHHEVHARLRARGHEVTEIVAGAVDAPAQQKAAPQLGALVDPTAYDVIVVDALARIVCAPWLAVWQAQRPLAAMIHELPSMAGEHADPADQAAEARLLQADGFIVVSAHGAAALIERGVAPERITIASGGLDRLGMRGTEEQRNRRTEEQRNRGTEEQRNRGTEERRNRGTEEQRNRGTGVQGSPLCGSMDSA